MAELHPLEHVTQELMTLFNISMPPIPVESMLQHPKPDMWEEVDISQLSGTFLRITDRYSPRMSIARLLARHIINSPWGSAHGLRELVRDEDTLHRFARMLMMPASMIMELGSSARTPMLISLHFEVPEEEARLRLDDLD